MTMEKGLPFKGEVRIDDPRSQVGAVYELSRGGAATTSCRGCRLLNIGIVKCVMFWQRA